MKTKPWRSMLFGDNNLAFRRSLTAYSGMLTLLVGVVLILKGVAGESAIDVKMAVVQGQLQSGSIGLLFSFLGFLLLVVCYLHQTASKLELTRSPDGTLSVTHQGSLTNKKVETIRLLVGEAGEEQKEPVDDRDDETEESEEDASD